MVKSNACILHNLPESKLVELGEDPRDPGGYFVINGSERVIVGLEDLSYNKIIVDIEESTGNLVYKAKVYSSIVGYRAKLELIMRPDGSIVATPSSARGHVPVDRLLLAQARASGLIFRLPAPRESGRAHGVFHFLIFVILGVSP